MVSFVLVNCLHNGFEHCIHLLQFVYHRWVTRSANGTCQKFDNTCKLKINVPVAMSHVIYAEKVRDDDVPVT